MRKFKFLLILSLLTLLLVGCKKDKKVVKENEVEETKPKGDATSILDGSIIDTSDIYSPVFGIMLDNHPEARPQSGLSEASIVYEYKVEGDYTRYLAIFQNSDAKQIGPVRSARPYFVQTIAEYDGIYAHFGGSELGIATINNLNVDDLDGMALEGSTFYRNKDVGKISPHNAYTSMKKLNEGLKDSGFDENRTFDGFIFDTSGENINSQMEGGNAAEDISIPFNPEYSVNFKYDEGKNSYAIYRDGKEIIDEYNDEEILASNIIIEFADSFVIGEAGTLEISHIGQGNGKLITAGKVIDITWTKETATSRTVFKTLNGEEIILAPGQTWIETVDNNTNITMK